MISSITSLFPATSQKTSQLETYVMFIGKRHAKNFSTSIRLIRSSSMSPEKYKEKSGLLLSNLTKLKCGNLRNKTKFCVSVSAYDLSNRRILIWRCQENNIAQTVAKNLNPTYFVLFGGDFYDMSLNDTIRTRPLHWGKMDSCEIGTYMRLVCTNSNCNFLGGPISGPKA